MTHPRNDTPWIVTSTIKGDTGDSSLQRDATFRNRQDACDFAYRSALVAQYRRFRVGGGTLAPVAFWFSPRDGDVISEEVS